MKLSINKLCRIDSDLFDEKNLKLILSRKVYVLFCSVLLFLEDITSDTRMIIINAVYFKGKWAQPFENSTKNLTFHTFENKTIKVPTMHVSGSFTNGVLDIIGNRFVELPYEVFCF